MACRLPAVDERFAAAVPISPVSDWFSERFESNLGRLGGEFLGGDVPDRRRALPRPESGLRGRPAADADPADGGREGPRDAAGTGRRVPPGARGGRRPDRGGPVPARGPRRARPPGGDRRRHAHPRLVRAVHAPGPAAVTSRAGGEPVHGVGFAEAARFWVKLGFVNFGGPAGQIALMHHELVDRRRWIGERRFLHALSYCTLLPGPEAQQLAIYVGWLLHRTLGGLVAGIAFILPAFFLMLGLAWTYVAHGDVGGSRAIFAGLAAAVVGIVAVAVIRLGRSSAAGSGARGDRRGRVRRDPRRRACRSRSSWAGAAAAGLLLRASAGRSRRRGRGRAPRSATTTAAAPHTQPSWRPLRPRPGDRPRGVVGAAARARRVARQRRHAHARGVLLLQGRGRRRSAARTPSSPT